MIRTEIKVKRVSIKRKDGNGEKKTTDRRKLNW